MRGVSITCLVALLAAGVVPSAAPDAAGSDEQLLREYDLPTDGPKLLECLRDCLSGVQSEERLRELIAALGDESFERRQEASRTLVFIGPRARGALAAARKHEDAEVRHRAARCLKEIDADGLAGQLLASAVRVLGKRRTPGAAALLLAQLPALREERLYRPVVYEVREALVDLALREGKAEPALVAALSDRLAARRAAAGVALARAGGADQLPALRGLLRDPDPEVRLPMALALARLKEKEAVPVLIAALEDQPSSALFAAAEDTLFRLAGDKSPTLRDGTAEGRQRYRKEWQRWWDDHKETADLGVLAAGEKAHGRTVVVLLDANEVLDLDANKQVRWRIDGVRMPLDIQPLENDRVLLAEYNGNRVTERNSKGEVVWEARVQEPLVAQRLANGNTFIASKDRLVEVDRTGKEVFNIPPPSGTQVMRARKLPGGEILLVTQLGVTHFWRLDRFGAVLGRFPVEVGTSGGRLDVTAAGNVLIPERDNNRVCEFDRDGRLVRAIPVSRPIACVALPNGHVLVTLMEENRAVELNRAGKEVWEYRRDTRVSRAVRY